MRRPIFIILLAIFSSDSYSFDSHDFVGCNVVKDRKSEQLFQLSKISYAERKLTTFTICSATDVGPYFVVLDMVPTAISSFRKFRSSELPDIPKKIQELTTKRETWISKIDNNRYARINDMFNYISKYNLGDDVNILDAETWCVHTRKIKHCYGAMDYEVKKRDLETFNRLVEELKSIFGV